MRFTPLAVEGAMLVEPEPHTDDRGLFARTFCAREFLSHGLPADFPQHSVSQNHRRGTLRGLHYQRAPHQESKLVRCLRGAVYDVILDLRVGTLGYGHWCAVELTGAARNAVFIPHGCAHGFQTREADTELLYLIDADYVPGSATGIRWDDPRLAIPWPIADPVLSPQDRQLPELR